MKLIDANQHKLTELEAQKARLIDAYTTGILGLDEIAPKKVELGKQIKKLKEAIKSLQGEMAPDTLTENDITEIHTFAAMIRKGLDKADTKFEARRKIAKLLRVAVVLSKVDDVKYAEVKCV